MADLESRLNDADAQKVLARALELQAQHAASLTVAQVRGIAAEMSIPESAVDQALSEYRAAGAAALLPPHSDPAAAHSALERAGSSRRLVTAMAVLGGFVVVLMFIFFLVRLSQ